MSVDSVALTARSSAQPAAPFAAPKASLQTHQYRQPGRDLQTRHQVRVAGLSSASAQHMPGHPYMGSHPCNSRACMKQVEAHPLGDVVSPDHSQGIGSRDPLAAAQWQHANSALTCRWRCRGLRRTCAAAPAAAGASTATRAAHFRRGCWTRRMRWIRTW